ncbi:protein of unknown function UPF0005 [Alicyclobacillus hesperidum URH17-3-68]|uniref:Membrane protein n=1 Tax=Alicyclobacillus hesperidum TaxID=89784 RepID=A0A1H2TQE2_9BACL|nr:sporulation membrane protein YtaF [Alicyclobacillus hesperidum]EJY56966.1 protein of unknown function UPF0005 [Alicyclobacillus hesperidum URH17-3-68]GLG02435.1 membrane protein [Alicyclobacillus hesperidum subsp. aegles]GLV13950.1 membrane protein [Alicyclobacillus hesperidum]SDW45988.1 putative sporulation protein YtaF [Alicyclobacillus hesperidum]
MTTATILTLVGLGIAANLDNAGVGIAYGVRRIQISTIANLLIAAISGVATLLSGWVGNTVSHYIHPQISNWLGAIVIMAVGLWVITEPIRSRRKRRRRNGSVIGRILDDPAAADFDNSQSISLTEASILGIALALNAFAGGFDAGVTHLSIWATTASVTAFSFILLGLAAYLGRRYAAQALGDKATYIAGALLILIGIHQVW